MSQLDAVFDAIRDRFDEQVATPNNLIVVHDNGPAPSTTTNAWCRFSVQVDSNSQISFGKRLFRSQGQATALLFVPLQFGDSAALQIADDILDAFRGVYLSNPNINFIPAPGVVGTADQDQSWCKRTVRIPFRHDEQVS